MAEDLLSAARWECCSTAPGAASDADGVDALVTEWWPAAVPGTAAGALRAAGVAVDGRAFDATDWWFRCRFAGGGAAGLRSWLLSLGGLATVADVWCNRRHLLHSENMFLAHEVPLAGLEADNELAIRFAALSPLLAVRRPRPRWKTYLLDHQNLRWFRTTLLGRMPGWAATPAPVGPWRPVRIEIPAPVRVVERHVRSSCRGADGEVEVRLRLRAAPAHDGAASSVGSGAVLHVGDHQGPLEVRVDGDDMLVEGALRMDGVRRWWPRTHGAQVLYPAAVEVGTHRVPLGRIGFRTVEVDRAGGGFDLRINGEPVFCRGAVWMPVDPVSMAPPEEEVLATLQLAADAHMNMVRVPGTGVYQDACFWDRCDELGILVWQDCMFAFVDPPDDPAFVADVERELTDVLGQLGGRPSVAVVCGGQEIEEQAAMLGLPRERWSVSLIEETIPALVGRLLPGVPYVTSNPTGGTLPFRMDSGVSHYFGVGGYLRPVAAARRDAVRFAAECLAFATPPEPQTIEEAFGQPAVAGHDPGWKLAVHHDAGRSWDLEDMQGHYVREVFGVDPFLARWRDPQRALDLGRAAVATVMASVMTEWRRPGSTCSGGLVLALRDLRPGAGWGLVDALGRPKAPWYALRRLFRPVVLLMTDEGLNGLRLHVVNDTPVTFEGFVRVALFAHGGLRLEEGRIAVGVPARGATVIEVADLFDGFRDITGAYGFGPPAYDVVVATLLAAAAAAAGGGGGAGEGEPVSEVVHLPAGPDRPREHDIGLEAIARPAGDMSWELEVSAGRFAQFVAIGVPGFCAEDSWFHLAPGATRTVGLRSVGGQRPHGHVRALNARFATRVVLPEGDR